VDALAELKEELAEERKDKQLLQSSILTLERWNDEKAIFLEEVADSLRDMSGEELERTIQIARALPQPHEKPVLLASTAKKKTRKQPFK